MLIRIAKEFRPLVLPFVFMSVAMVFPWFDPKNIFHAFALAQPDLRMVSWFVWIAGATVISIRSFAFEYQDKTMVFLMSQPVSRFVIWRDKLIILIPIVALLSLGFAMLFTANGGSYRSNRELITIGVCSVIASICSAAFWVSVGRTTVGAFVFSLFSQVLLMLLTFALLGDTIRAPSGMLLAIKVIAFTYSAGCLVLGWRRFTRIEGNEPPARPFQDAAAGNSAGWWLAGGLLRCGPRFAWINVLRREIVLQRGSFLMAVLSIACAAVMMTLDAFATNHVFRDSLFVMRFVPFAVCMVLMAVVVPTIAFTEERHLGTHNLSLTLPMRAGTQFLLKVLTALLIFLTLGVALPLGAMAIYYKLLPESFDEYSMIRAALLVPVFLATAFVLSARVATFISNSVSAIFTAVLLTVACMYAAYQGMWWAQELFHPEYYWHLLYGTFLARWMYTEALMDILPVAFAGFVVLRLVWLAFLDFRVQPAQSRVPGRLLGCLLMALATGGGFGVARQVSATAGFAEVQFIHTARAEIGKAILRVDQLAGPGPLGEIRVYDWKDVAATGLVSASTLERLGGTKSVRVRTIRLPIRNGESRGFSWYISPLPQIQASYPRANGQRVNESLDQFIAGDWLSR